MPRTEKTIFNMLRQLEQTAETKKQKAAYNCLVDFIENAKFPATEVEKSICKDWRLSSKEMAAKSLKKSESAFRSQIYTLNSKIIGILGYDVDAINNAFVNEDDAVLNRISDISTASGVLHQGDFGCSLLDFIPETAQVYSIDECQDELKLLKAFEKQSLIQLLSGYDLNKLRWLLTQMREPFYIKENKSYKINEVQLNFAKQYIEKNPVSIVDSDKEESIQDTVYFNGFETVAVKIIKQAENFGKQYMGYYKNACTTYLDELKAIDNDTDFGSYLLKHRQDDKQELKKLLTAIYMINHE